jgi:uncharacterized protein
MESQEFRFAAGDRVGAVSGLLLSPPVAKVLYVLAHGAGAGMKHPFMEAITGSLAERGIATFRYQFPYVEAGGRRPDPPAVLEAAVRAAVAQASSLRPGLPLIAGGKSLGGRMTSGAVAHGGLPGVRGLVFLGFPLHPAGAPSVTRAAHLAEVQLPMLFLQGTRDELASSELIRPVCESLAPRGTLHFVDGADHGFGVLKRSGRTNEDVLRELSEAISVWAEKLL